MRMWRRIITVIALTIAMVIGTFAIATPAQAATTYRFTVYGSQYANMTAFPTLCNGCWAPKNVIRFWQNVLYAHYYGNLSAAGHSCTSFVDGVFGPNTATWSKQFQLDHGLQNDGFVGPLTWSAAEEGAQAGNITTWLGLAYGYYGTYRKFVFWLDDTTWSLEGTCNLATY
jgi:peptidoglycan hydrolase-like protein with peptidoglycan-binding domain